MRLTSPSFATNQAIPQKHTSKGAGVSPAFFIEEVPAGAQSLALVVHDIDAVEGDFTHWIVWNVPAGTSAIAEGQPPSGALQGTNDEHEIGYCPPSPPPGTGTHRYIFDLYALNTSLQLSAGASLDDLRKAMSKHAIEQTQLVGLATA